MPATIRLRIQVFLDVYVWNDEAMHRLEDKGMKGVLGFLLICTGALSVLSFAANESYWPYWRGPAADGMAVGDAPLNWSDTQNVKWKADIPGRGSSSPVIWGDRIFVTTAIPTGAPAKTEAKQEAPATPAPKFGRGMGFGGPPPVEQNFVVLCFDRETGKELWRRTATTATPHESLITLNMEVLPPIHLLRMASMYLHSLDRAESIATT